MTAVTMDISGCWMGTYWQAAQPTRFEATLIQGGSVLDGRILDENYLGEAWIKGELLGSRVFFIKRYLTTSPSPIRYSGTLSEDGDYMHGHWRIGYFDSGTWEAYRAYDSLNDEFSSILVRKTAISMAFAEDDYLLTRSFLHGTHPQAYRGVQVQ